ncbi:hypothetical protein FACS1894168_1080 [Deltaproteobacteria bacterium]|nr:hypothetical protein FACS1894168_1080 [Deltaproteobacteria bacterium]
MPHRLILLACVGVALILAGFISSRFFVREDIRTLMPSEPARLAQNFAMLREAPFLRRLTITVDGMGHDVVILADTIADKLRSDEIPNIITGPDVTAGPNLLTRFCDFAPSFLDSEDLAHVSPLLEPKAMTDTLEEDKRNLIGPQGLALRELIAKDPLNVRSVLFAKVASFSADRNNLFGVDTRAAKVERGHVLDATGRYAMLWAEPAAPMSDSAAAVRIMERYHEAIKDLPKDVKTFLVGGYRHTAANATAIKSDLNRILPVSIVLLALLFIKFIHEVRGIWLFLLPVASLIIAVFISGLLFSTISGIIIGFGSVVIGITADYAIHVFFAVRSTPDIGLALRNVSRPLGVGVVTTLAAFAALLFSTIPAISQMAIFAMIGVCAAFILALVVLPHCLISSTAPGNDYLFPKKAGDQGKAKFRHPCIIFIWLAVTFSMAYFALTVPMGGDIRKLAYIPEEVQSDEQATSRIWSMADDVTLVVAQGGIGDTGFEEALQVNDAIWGIFTAHGYGAKAQSKAVTSLAPLLPSRKIQERRHTLWNTFWARERDNVLTHLDTLRQGYGFSQTAFAPFANWITNEPVFVTPETLTSLGMELIVNMMSTVSSDGRKYVFTIVPKDIPLSPDIIAEIESAGAHVLSGRDFSEDLSLTTRNDCLAFCLFSFLAVSFLMFCFFPSFDRWALAMSPMIASILAVTATFRIMDIPMTVFHAAALPLIMGLAVDYGIFIVNSIEGRSKHANENATSKAVLLSGLTTLAGFGCLTLAKHPALYSLGVTVSAGMGVAVLTALWGIPRMGRVFEERV